MIWGWIYLSIKEMIYESEKKYLFKNLYFLKNTYLQEIASSKNFQHL